GPELGQRVWQQLRSMPALPPAAVSDREIVLGLIRHLSRQAAGELKKADRMGKFVRLTIWHRDGTSATQRKRLAILTRAPDLIAESAIFLFDSLQLSPEGTRSIDLDVTAVGDELPESNQNLAWLAVATDVTGPTPESLPQLPDSNRSRI